MVVALRQTDPGPAGAVVPGTLKLSAEIRRYLRDLVGERDGWTCFYCGRDVVPPPRGRGYNGAEGQGLATLDHWTPAARGGSWELSNLVMACMPCNDDKHTLAGDEYVLVLAYRKRRDQPRRWWSPIAAATRLAVLAYRQDQGRSRDHRRSPISRRTGTTGRTTVRRAEGTVRPFPGAVGRTVPGTGPETSTRTASETASETGGPMRDRGRHEPPAQHVTTGHGPSESRGATTTGMHTLAGFPPGNLPDPDDTPRASGPELDVVTGGPVRGLGGAGGERSSRPAREETRR